MTGSEVGRSGSPWSDAIAPPAVGPVEVVRGAAPLVLGQPHGGIHVPADIWAGLNPIGQALADTDWRIDTLFEGLAPGATIVRATTHRYVIDANRDPDGVSLYPGQNTTALCPLTDFDGADLHRPGAAPDAAEVRRRRDAYHRPYHAALASEIDRLRGLHGAVLLFDCHSIRSNIPFLFEGELPVLNIGTNGGVTCAPAIEEAAVRAAERSGLPWVLNGRFKGGWTTRHYGRPTDAVHAIQLEIAQRAYLSAEAPPWTFDPDVAAPLRMALGDMLTSLQAEIAALSRAGSAQ